MELQNKTLTFNDYFPLSEIPSPKRYFNAHCHARIVPPGTYVIANIDDPEIIIDPSEFGIPLSVGYHPWDYYKPDASKKLSLVSEYSHHQAVLAIGECGIDRSIEIPVPEQEEIFRFHADLAEQQQKALIIHCVKAYSDFARIMKQIKPSVPWIFHGFKADVRVAYSLIRLGAYLSIGKDILRQNSKIRYSIRDICLDRLLLETDTWPYPIQEIYLEVSKLTGISIESLKEQMFENFKKCFLFKWNLESEPSVG